MTTADIALDLAASGIAVFPCHSSGEEAKRPMPGVFWRNQSTTDRAKIENWWRRWPEAAIGIDLAKSGLLVIDCDCKPGRPNGVVNFEALGHDLSGVPTVATPSGGRHFYFRQSFDPPHGNGRGTLPPGIDVRGHGGYVIAPGCRMEAGDYVSIVSADPPDPPPWLVGLIRPLVHKTGEYFPVRTQLGVESPYAQKALRDEVERIRSAPQGTWNDTINAASFNIGQLVPHLLSASEATSALEDAARSLGIGPKDRVFGKRGTIARALADGMAEPRGPDDHNPYTRELVDVSGLLIDTTSGEVLKEPEIPSGDLPDEIMADLPGLLGDIVQWIVASSIKPQPALALGAALSLIGTMAGRQIAGPTLSGTHLYVVGLADSGAGKDHPKSAIGRIMAALNLHRHHLGPDEFISMPAVINFLCRKPLSLCAMDEFGSFLKRVNNKKASGFEFSISKTLRTLWGSSFEPFSTPEWAGKEAVTILHPSMSIFAVSTPGSFYEALASSDLENGFLNRFLVFEAKTSPEIREPTADKSVVPESIVDGLLAIFNRKGDLNAGLCTSIDPAPSYEKLAWATPEVNQRYLDVFKSFEEEASANPARGYFLKRTAEMALRIATIRAVAADVNYPALTLEDFEWGLKVAMHSAETMIRGVGDNMAETDFQRQAKLVLGYIKQHKRITRSKLCNLIDSRLDPKTITNVISSLVDSGKIEECRVVKEGAQRSKPTLTYRVISEAPE